MKNNTLRKNRLLSAFGSLSVQQKLACIFVVLAMIFGIITIVITPPFVSPDEVAHYYNICRISHGSLFPVVEYDAVGSYITLEEFEFCAENGSKYNFINSELYSFSAFFELLRSPASTDLVFVDHNSATINPLAYAVISAIIFILRIFGFSFNAFSAFLFGKFINLVIYTVIIAWAISKTKALPKTMFILALMPMSIYQGASLSYDAPLIACTFLLFAYISKIICSEKEKKVALEDIIAITLSTVVIASTKYAYLILLLVLFTISIKKFVNTKQYFLCIGIVTAAVVVSYLIPSLILSEIASGYQPPLTEAQVLQKEYFASHYWEFPKVLYKTVKALWQWYATSIYGLLGRADVPLPMFAQNIFYVGFAVCAALELSSVKGIRWHTRLVSLIGCAICVIGTAVAMFVSHTPLVTNAVTTEIIWGIQGRYFIPLIPFVVVVAASPLLLKFKHNNKLQTVLTYTVIPFSIFHLVIEIYSLISAYWI